ncbi:YkvA family protein [Psychroflexus salis]|uniref:DUF1232 domain-containing protein n=1 Tax=Psychroflexus salis TaxID=1526574 RepID=A0A917EBS4_9FLAO|nr:YkvA family protein [Psychroflexus salis]GGE20600.1 hypothetical protein GCM10010831_22130 [Psychroflexus salis]
MKKSSKNIDEAYINKNAENLDKDQLNEALENEGKIKSKLKYLQDFKNQIILLFQLLKDYKNKRYKQTPWLSIAAIVFVLLYILNPLDLIPDFIPFVGYIDDASVIAVTYKMINSDIENYQIWKKENQEIKGEVS